MAYASNDDTDFALQSHISKSCQVYSDSSHFVSQSRCKILHHHFSSIDLPVVACPGENNNWGTDRESNSTF